jgi:hypothetical protein
MSVQKKLVQKSVRCRYDLILIIQGENNFK